MRVDLKPSDKKAAEQQNFRRQKQPHSYLDGLVLMLQIGEVVLLVRIMVLAMLPPVPVH